MYFEYDEKIKMTLCYTEKDDDCVTCSNFDICPLVSCLENHLVIPHFESIHVENCPLKGTIEID